MFQSATIFSLSSGPPPSGVAIIRVSGPLAKTAAQKLCGVVPADRTVRLTDFRDVDGALLDRGLVVIFSAPASFTGEDCTEFHIHGGRASIAAVIGSLGAMPGLRQAEAGEFTRRAFVNGKVDLTGVEALGDLINAETEMQRRFALANAGGRQFAAYAAWRGRILHARAMIEAELDFSDESDVPGSIAETIWNDVAALCDEMRAQIDNARTGEILREGFQVVILGAPNAGKSSLVNRLADRDVAIVTDEPGTTRDLVEVVLDLDGVRAVVTDTAGLRDEPGRVEAIGIERALKRAAECDLVIMLEDVNGGEGLAAPAAAKVLRVGSKTDIAAAGFEAGRFDLVTSAKTGQGVDALVERIRQTAAARVGGWSSTALPSRLRHVELIRSALNHLADAMRVDNPLELRAEALRLAGDDVGGIVGEIGTEEVLGAIFGQFCIGK
ncbi:MAG: tRNA uridine-5-carboxymethylaminomethyl(34) synthesis GTPase MnmE [Rhizobiaceae bacterium]